MIELGLVITPKQYTTGIKTKIIINVKVTIQYKLVPNSIDFIMPPIPIKVQVLQWLTIFQKIFEYPQYI